MKRRIFIKRASLIAIGLSLPSVLIKCRKEEPNKIIGNLGKVLVLGAGIAGLSAAYKLKNKGYEVKVIEASNRYGGRIQSVEFKGYKADLGASWIHGITNNPLYSLANSNSISTKLTYYNPSYIFDIDGSDITEQEWNTIKPYLDQLTDIAYNNQELSLLGVLAIIAPQLNLTDRLTRLFYGAVRSEIEIPYAVDAKDISAKALLIDDSFPGDDVIFPNGMQQLTDVLAKNLDIVYNKFVIKVDYNEDKIKVYTKKYSDVPQNRACKTCHTNVNAVGLNEDDVFVADKVIVTFPLEMLKNKNVVFSPPLSALKEHALNDLQMGTMNKVFLKFNQNFWHNDAYFLELLNSNYSHIIEYFSPTPTGTQNILVAVLAGYHAKYSETLSDIEVTASIMAELKKMFGNNIPQPTGIYRTAWHSNPLSLGSYPHLKPGAKIDACQTIAESIDNKVFFAGDVTSKKYLATAHGAYISGLDAVKEIMG